MPLVPFVADFGAAGQFHVVQKLFFVVSFRFCILNVLQKKKYFIITHLVKIKMSWLRWRGSAILDQASASFLWYPHNPLYAPLF